MARIEERNIALWVVISVLTCGIGAIIWFIYLGNDIADVRGASKPNPVIDLLLSVVTCGIWSIFVMYQWPGYIKEAGLINDVQVDDQQILSLILAILGLSIVSMALMQVELNKIAVATGRRQQGDERTQP